MTCYLVVILYAGHNYIQDTHVQVCDDRWTHPRPGYPLVGGPRLLAYVYV